MRTILDEWTQPARNVGSNRLYSTRRGNCYFQLDPSPDQDNCYMIHTNSSLLFTANPFKFQSDCPSSNLKFILSKFLTFFFSCQTRIPSRAHRKYFNRIRQLLLTQRVTSLAHWSSSHQNNRRTRTFIQFRYRQSCFYLGLYFGCPYCKLPAAYVMSRFHHACHMHNKRLIETPPAPPAPPFSLPYERVSKRTQDGFFKDITSRRLGVSYRKTYAFHDILTHDDGTLATRTFITYSDHKPIPHPTKKQLARQRRHSKLLTYRHKSSRHIISPDVLDSDSSMWMVSKEPAIIILPSAYKLTMSTTDYLIVQSVCNLVSLRPDISICMEERSCHSSLAFISSRFTGSIQKVVLNPSALVTSQYFPDDPKSGPFVGVSCSSIDSQDLKSLGFNRSIIDMV